MSLGESVWRGRRGKWEGGQKRRLEANKENNFLPKKVKKILLD